eukprot:GHVQ01043538.1.p1 GENE.GHVQ01043538.1~~GHVQ01043538.1.p1  ORF type:complete len:505 (+),score=126.65 GHVQ01043538.1:319-1833(+)
MGSSSSLLDHSTDDNILPKDSLSPSSTTIHSSTTSSALSPYTIATCCGVSNQSSSRPNKPSLSWESYIATSFSATASCLDLERRSTSNNTSSTVTSSAWPFSLSLSLFSPHPTGTESDDVVVDWCPLLAASGGDAANISYPVFPEPTKRTWWFWPSSSLSSETEWKRPSFRDIERGCDGVTTTERIAELQEELDNLRKKIESCRMDRHDGEEDDDKEEAVRSTENEPTINGGDEDSHCRRRRRSDLLSSGNESSVMKCNEGWEKDVCRKERERGEYVKWEEEVLRVERERDRLTREVDRAYQIARKCFKVCGLDAGENKRGGDRPMHKYTSSRDDETVRRDRPDGPAVTPESGNETECMATDRVYNQNITQKQKTKLTEGVTHGMGRMRSARNGLTRDVLRALWCRDAHDLWSADCLFDLIIAKGNTMKNDEERQESKEDGQESSVAADNFTNSSLMESSSGGREEGISFKALRWKTPMLALDVIDRSIDKWRSLKHTYRYGCM